MVNKVVIRLNNFLHIKIGQGAQYEYQRPVKESKVAPLLTVRSGTRGPKLHNNNVYAKCLGQAHAGSLFVSSVSVCHDEPRLADSVNSPVVSMNFWGPTILSPPVL